MNAPTVRPFKDTDTPGAARALISVHATDGYPVEGVDEPEAWIQAPDVISAWIAETNAAIVGHVAIMRPNGEEAVSLWQRQSGADESTIAVLARLFVIREARKKATGERLMRAATEHARQKRLRLVLDVMTKDTAAIHLYERLGWKRIGQAIHRYGNSQHTDALCYVSPENGPA